MRAARHNIVRCVFIAAFLFPDVSMIDSALVTLRSSLSDDIPQLYVSHSSHIKAQPQQKGKASYYARKFTGRKTANGEIFHHDSMTCAHRKYKFGTLLKVSNPANGNIVVVRVNDRGPFVRGRIIDLSWKAAKQLGIISQGVAMVRVEPLNVTMIPFRPQESYKLPEFNFELSSERPVSFKPDWQQLKELNQK